MSSVERAEAPRFPPRAAEGESLAGSGDQPTGTFVLKANRPSHTAGDSDTRHFCSHCFASNVSLKGQQSGPTGGHPCFFPRVPPTALALALPVASSALDTQAMK